MNGESSAPRERVGRFLATYAPYRGGRSVASHAGEHLILADLRALLASGAAEALEGLCDDPTALLSMEVAETEFYNAGGGSIADKHRLVLRMLAAHLRELEAA